MTQATKTTAPAKKATAPVKASTPAQVFDFSTLAVEDSARPTRTAGRTAQPIPKSLQDAVTASWAGRERRANGRYVGKGKTLPTVPGSQVKPVMAFLRRAAIAVGAGVGIQIQDRQGNKVLPKDLNERANYKIVFAAQTAKEKKDVAK